MTIIQSDAQPWIKSTCAYCGVGCGIEAQINTSSSDNEYSVTVRGDASHPANFGRLCSKGLALGETAINQGRLSQPEINGEASSWEPALDLVADTFRQTIAKHGPDSVAFYVSGQLLTEDYYVANKLMKGFIGSGNIDTNSRLCMSSSVAGHKRAFGTDTVPNTYTDLEQSDLVVLVGSNFGLVPPSAIPALKGRQKRSPRDAHRSNRPTRNRTASIADLFLPIKPGADVLLFNGLLNHLAKPRRSTKITIDQHTEGFQSALAQAESDCSDSDTFYAKLGLPASLVNTFYQWVTETEKTPDGLFPGR